ncbi:MAG: hypothetical protein QF464_23460, partial [Myxococcota bacterium]|nr:hypothetical protein [Myxococcota bacterium]
GLAVKARIFETDGTPRTDVLDLNHRSEGDQFTPGVAVLAEDEWVVAFADSEHRVWTRRFDRDGLDVVGRLERTVSDTTEGDQEGATGVEGPDGEALVAWSSPFNGTSDKEIVARRINDEGKATTGDVQLNEKISGDQTSPALAATPDGWFAVWQSGASDDALDEIVGRMVDAQGSPVGDEFTIPSQTAGDQRHPSVAVGDDTGLVVWDSDAVTPGSQWHIASRLMDLNGQPLDEEVTLSTGERAFFPVVAALPDGGGYVVAWETKEQSTWDVVVRRLDAQGQPLGDAVLAHAASVHDEKNAAIAVAPSGAYLHVCVTHWSSALTTAGIGCQRIDADSLAHIGPELVPHNAGEQ